MATGTVERFVKSTGYGFIRGDNGQTFFAHYSGIVGHGFRYLDEGDEVEFDTRPAQRSNERPLAVNIRVRRSATQESWEGKVPETEKTGGAGHVEGVASGTGDASAVPGKPEGESTTVLPNPFDIEPVRDPRLIVGRREELRGALALITSNRNLAISGGIGVGKSTLLNAIIAVCRRDANAINEFDVAGLMPPEPFAVVKYDVTDGDTLDQVRAGLLAEFHRAYVVRGLRGWARRALFSVEQLAKGRIGIAMQVWREESSATDRQGTKEHTFIDRIVDFISLEEHIVRYIRQFVHQGRAVIDGKKIEGLGGPLKLGRIIFVIDELHKLPREGNAVGSFVKNIGARFAPVSTDSPRVSFILCGSENIRQRIAHEGADLGQVFAPPIEVPGMEGGELKEVFENCEKRGSKRFQGDVKDLFVRCAQGNPRIAILLGALAYQDDDDGTVTREDCAHFLKKETRDVVRAEFGPGMQLASWRQIRKILSATAKCYPEYIRGKDIEETGELTAQEAGPYLRILRDGGILESTPAREGGGSMYRLSDPILSAHFRLADELAINLESGT